MKRLQRKFTRLEPYSKPVGTDVIAPPWHDCLHTEAGGCIKTVVQFGSLSAAKFYSVSAMYKPVLKIRATPQSITKEVDILIWPQKNTFAPLGRGNKLLFGPRQHSYSIFFFVETEFNLAT